MIKIRRPILLLCYLILVAAAVFESFMPNILRGNVTFSVIVSAFLISGLAGSAIHSKIVRSFGWIGIALFTLLILWNTFSYDFHLASVTWERPPALPRPQEFDWRLPILWVQDALLVICYERLGVHSGKFYIVAGFFLTAVCSTYLTLNLEAVPTGSIDIEYAASSSKGIFWNLKNFSTRSIYLVMDGDEIFAPAVTTICRASDGVAETSEKLRPFTPVSLTTVKIVPGERVQLNVAASLPSKYRGGQCRLRLELLGGTFVESKEFTPH